MTSKYSFPAEYASASCYVVTINAALIPIIAGQLRMLEARGSWESSGDYVLGYNAILAFERCLMSLCMDDLITSQERLYRLIERRLIGTEYTLGSGGVISPAIDVVPVDNAASDADSLFGRIDRVTQLIDNSINGTETPLYAYAPSVKDLLQSVIDALGTDNTDLASILSQLELIAGLVA